MVNKKFVVKLSSEERERLREVISTRRREASYSPTENSKAQHHQHNSARRGAASANCYGRRGRATLISVAD